MDAHEILISFLRLYKAHPQEKKSHRGRALGIIISISTACGGEFSRDCFQTSSFFTRSIYSSSSSLFLLLLYIFFSLCICAIRACVYVYALAHFVTVVLFSLHAQSYLSLSLWWWLYAHFIIKSLLLQTSYLFWHLELHAPCERNLFIRRRRRVLYEIYRPKIISFDCFQIRFSVFSNFIL